VSIGSASFVDFGSAIPERLHRSPDQAVVFDQDRPSGQSFDQGQEAVSGSALEQPSMEQSAYTNGIFHGITFSKMGGQI
jgi:hypothetical protein